MSGYAGRYWQTLPNGKIRCDLCPRYCTLGTGQRGFCFVRQNVDDQLELTTYNRSSGFCIDPIEKKPLNHFYPGSSVLSFGTAGCNLGCKFCQNWSMTKSREWDKLMEPASPRRIANTCKKYGCGSVAFTYNDPVIFAEYAMDVADACRDTDIKTVAVTAGYITEKARSDFFSKMDAANVDLKAFSDRFYRKLTLSSLQPVLDTLEFIRHETNTWLEITTLVIPGENDSDREFDLLTSWIAEKLGPDVPLHFSAFHPDFRMKDYPGTSLKTLLTAREIGLSNGLSHIYIGNVYDPHASNTYCSGCGNLLIERRGYELGQYNIRDGRCLYCAETCAGHFENEAGTWGSKRLPIRISR